MLLTTLKKKRQKRLWLSKGEGQGESGDEFQLPVTHPALFDHRLMPWRELELIQQQNFAFSVGLWLKRT